MPEQATRATDTREHDIMKMSSDIIAAYVSNNPVPVAELPGFIKNVHTTFTGLSSVNGEQHEQTNQKPAVPVKKSVQHDYIVCLEDGKKLKMLKRYLRSNYRLTPEQYRAKWGLALDYPMVAPAYAAQRSEFAKKIGLGRTGTKTRGRNTNTNTTKRIGTSR